MDAMKNTVQNVLSHSSSSGTGKKVLITGGSGFVAAHVLNSFLSRGYHVRTSVRSQSSAEKIKKTHAKYVERIEFAMVSDIEKEGAFDEAVKGVDGVIHTASPFVMDVKDNVKDLLDPAMKGTSSLLNSVAKCAPNVKRVIITSSFAAICDIDKGAWPGHIYTEKDWNPVTYETAASPDAPGSVVYCASKTFAEKLAWDFVAEKKPSFTVSTICPPMVYGPAANEPADLEKLNTSSADIYRLINGSLATVPSTSFYAFVDVRDVAEAHALAYESAQGGERYFVTGGGFTYQQIVDIIAKHFPELKGRYPEQRSQESLEEVYKVDNSKARRLGVRFTTLEDCIVDMVREFLVIEKRLGKTY